MLGTNSTQIEFTLQHPVPMNGPLVDSPLPTVLGLQTYAVPVKNTTSCITSKHSLLKDSVKHEFLVQ